MQLHVYTNSLCISLLQILCHCTCSADNLQEMLTKEAGFSLTDEERTYKDKLRQRHWEKAIIRVLPGGSGAY